VDTSLAWLYEEEGAYRRQTGEPLWSISDWHNDPGDIALPTTMLAGLRVDAVSMSRYRFLDTVNSTKGHIGSFYRCYCGVNLDPESFALCSNGTAALTLSIRCLAEQGVRRMLVLTPAYFSLFKVLDSHGITTIYMHSDLTDEIVLDVDRILHIARHQMVDAVFITNPVFSTGLSLTPSSLRDLIKYAECTGTWLILDETLAGLPWHSGLQSPFVTHGMHEALQCSRSIYIWSVSKSLFLNGLKHSLVLAPAPFVARLEKAADMIVGGLTAHQVASAEQIYSDSNMQEIYQCTRRNIAQFSATYDLCATCLSRSPLKLTSVDSGFHTITFIPKLTANNAAVAQLLAATMIRRHGISIIPLAHFGFPQFSPIGFRINLSKNSSKLYDALFLLSEIIHKDPHLAH